MYKIIIFLITIFLSCNIFAAKPNFKIKQYVNELVNQASSLLNDEKISEEQRGKRSRQLFAKNLDLEWMAKYTLGRHRKELDVYQIKDFTKIYSTYIVKTYSDLVRNYRGEKTVIKKVVQLDDTEYIVKTEIVQNSQPPLKVDYLVRDIGTAKAEKSALRISDIITEGVSMVNSQQAEFNSIIGNRGFDSLLMQLKKKS